jgi:endonuclease/exonuclease/phosphatase family metal-dependent hydrolase
LGADIRRILGPGELSVNVAQTWQIIRQTDFPQRAKALAKLIARENPDVLGLQEAARFVLLDYPSGTVKSVQDNLEILRQALAAEGANYRVADDGATRLAISDNIDVTLLRCLEVANDASCAGGIDLLRYTDRDAILINQDVTQVKITDNAAYRFNLPVDLGGQQGEVTRSYLVLEADVNGDSYRIVNTHLEVTGPELGDPAASFFQQQQAAELIDLLGRNRSPLPTIIVADLNSPADAVADSARPYQQFVDAGYVDTWLDRNRLHPTDGATCCRTETLRVEDSARLTDRIDYVLARNDAADRPDALLTPVARVVGVKARQAASGGLWASDHAAVAAKIKFE